MKITIVVPYYDRPKALQRLQNHYFSKLNKNHFDIIISEVPTETSGKFNTAKALNQGVEKAKTDWILKNDVDCVPEFFPELYAEALAFIQSANQNDFTIFGAKYMNPNFTFKKRQCGNEVLFHKSAWESVGGVPEWQGYGFEDYLFEYNLMRNRGLPVKLSDCKTPRDMTNKFRDEYLIPLNNMNHNWFVHHYHTPVFVAEMVKINHQRFFEEINRIENAS